DRHPTAFVGVRAADTARPDDVAVSVQFQHEDVLDAMAGQRGRAGTGTEVDRTLKAAGDVRIAGAIGGYRGSELAGWATRTVGVAEARGLRPRYLKQRQGRRWGQRRPDHRHDGDYDRQRQLADQPPERAQPAPRRAVHRSSRRARRSAARPTSLIL